jgi:hypothetical protein
MSLDNFILQRGDQRLTAAGTVAIGAGSANRNDLNVRRQRPVQTSTNCCWAIALTGVRNATEIPARATIRCAIRVRDYRWNSQSVQFNAPSGKAATRSRRRPRVSAEQTPQAVLTASPFCMFQAVLAAPDARRNRSGIQSRPSTSPAPASYAR